MASLISITDFIQKIFENILPIIDVRSENEFDHGHIPGAINLPLLKNEQRVIIGTTYKKLGREDAVKKGFELVGPSFSDIISLAEKIAPERKVLLYCWRGGMRSNIVAWLLNMAGFQVFLLKGGYKAYRGWTLEQLNNPKKLLIIGGKTGTGKTELLQALNQKGEQIIDLEGIACHKGSAFGALGQKPQPTNEQFENILALKWVSFDDNKWLWIENESQSIGSNIVPKGIYEQMRTAPVIEIILDKQTRKKRILSEYGIFSTEELAVNTKKVAKRLGGLRLKHALLFLENNDLSSWADIMMEYYDDTYNHSNKGRDLSKTIILEIDHDRMVEQVDHLIAKTESVIYSK